MDKKWTILGQDPDILLAMMANLLSWVVSTYFPSFLPKLLPACDEEEEQGQVIEGGNTTKCVSIGRPGGMEQLRVIHLKKGIVTVGYNVRHFCTPPFTPVISEDAIEMQQTIPSDCVILNNKNFSVNYADCTIRWGLYESAKRFVGWPIVPGFDVAGVIDSVGGSTNTSTSANDTDFKKGDRVFGVTLFGAYSDRILIPKIQLRKIPDGIPFAQAASLPTVSLTALYALCLAGYFPITDMKYSNNSILIHSAAGGVGSMLVQISKILGLGPIVGVVGSTSKVEEAKSLGCDVVIDKSKEDLWTRAEEVSPQDGFKTIMDANGVSTLQQSYNHLAPTGRLVIFGFHSNLPVGADMLSPMEWIRMAKKMSTMPKFDPMDLVVENKSVLGFNLSFFAAEKDLVSSLFDQVCDWLKIGALKCPRVVTMDIAQIGEAHSLIQSGSSIGKIVINT
jgi:NADPH:quinone reductase-like Zn-dependent oxidoreductase